MKFSVSLTTITTFTLLLHYLYTTFTLPLHYFYTTIYITFSIASGGGHTPKIQTTRFKIRPVFFMEA